MPNTPALKDPYLAEAFYYARQGDYFEAVARLDAELRQHYGVDEPQLDTLHFQINDAEFAVGDFELSYRMHLKAGRALKAVSEGNVAPVVRNEALYRLARIYFQKSQNIDALHAIERIEGELPAGIVDEAAFLRGQIYLASGRLGDAERIFSVLQGKKGFAGFADYNLGIAQLLQNRREEGVLSLARAGAADSRERGVAEIRDKSNLLLASRFMDEGQFQDAQYYFDRVSLEGPFSNRALLGYGWAEVKQEHYARALVPWSILAEREVTDLSVQEALLGVPYVYSKLGLYGKSAMLYNQAISAFDSELARLDASIKSIGSGKFLAALLREEIKQDKDWLIKLRELDDAPETYYLMPLLASHDFQLSLQNYLDLDALLQKLDSLDGDIAAFGDIVAVRRQYYEPLLPSLDERFRKWDSLGKLRMQQRDKIGAHLNNQLVSANPAYLATVEERLASAQLAAMELRLGSRPQGDPAAQRIRRLKGLLHWNRVTAYDDRLAEAFNHLAGLDAEIAQAQQAREAFVRTRQAATQSYQGYDPQLERLRNDTHKAREKVEALMARQGRMIEAMALSELTERREKLEQYQIKARLGLADSYDRATMLRPAEKTEYPGDDVAPAIEEAVPPQKDIAIDRWLP